MTPDSVVLETFLAETEERLDDLESGILSLTDLGPDPELVHAIFRDAHSVKAGANLLGYRNIETLSHRLENILDMIRTGRMTPDVESTDALLGAVDRIRDLLENLESSNDMDIARCLADLARVAPGNGNQP